MRYIILAMFLVGCADSIESDAPPTQWAVTVNAGDDPSIWSCAGTMTLSVVQSDVAPRLMDVTGSWECGDLGGPITRGAIAPNGTIAFDMATTPDASPARFLGVMDGLKFSGHAELHGGELPVIATPR